MRICLLSKEYPPDTGWGGIGAYNYQIAHGLKEIGHEVEVVALAKPDVPMRSDLPPDNDEGIIVHRVPWKDYMSAYKGMLITAPTSHFMFKTNMLLWTKFLKIHKLRPFDVLETPEHLAEGFLPAISKWLPVVLKLHTPYSKFIQERFHNTTVSFDHQLIAMLERLAITSADALMSPSGNLVTYIADDMNYPSEKIDIVKNPIDAQVFTPEGNRAIPANGHLTVLFVGRLEERKGIHYLIEAIPQIVENFKNSNSKLRFVIIGGDTKTATGHKPVLPELEQSLAKSGYRNNVTFIPHAPLSEMPAYYRSADVCIVPSLYDNAPYTCLEAMACGRAVIGTAAGGMPEYITNGESGIIIPAGNTEAIVNAITKLLKDRNERCRLGQNARNYILANIHRTQIAKRNEEVYRLAIARYSHNKETAIYRHSASTSLVAAQNMLYTYETMIYDLLYVKSWRFRLRHWLKIISQPDLFLAKLIVQMSRKFFGPLSSQFAYVAKLDKQINEMNEAKKRLLKPELEV